MAGHYGLAASLVAAHMTGTYPEAVSFDSIFSSLCERCLMADLNPGMQQAWLLHADVQELLQRSLGGDLYGTGAQTNIRAVPVAESWAIIHALLERHDGAHTGFRYHRLVVECVLTSTAEHTDTHLVIPLWLRTSYQTKDAATLLRLYLTYDDIAGATDVIVALVKSYLTEKVSIPGFPVIRSGLSYAGSAWLPMDVVEMVQERASDDPQLKEKLDKAMTTYQTVGSGVGQEL